MKLTEAFGMENLGPDFDVLEIHYMARGKSCLLRARSALLCVQ